MKAFLIAAPRSGAGKTMVSLGLMRALSDRGLKLHPFKSGPDYIDTQFHAVASRGQESENLDLFMSSAEYVRRMFARQSAGCDVAVIEGAMGLFDGYDEMTGSAADVAVTLGVPVVMVVDASSMAFSAAALLYGFSRFAEGVNVVGVIFNRVASERHRTMLAAAARSAGVECLGFIGRLEGLQTPSRHLGLTLTGLQSMEEFSERAAEAVSRVVDLDRLLAVTEYEPERIAEEDATPRGEEFIVAVARDEAFNFLYPANLRALQRSGGRIEFFSPMRSEALPAGTGMIYLPGGYPELYAAELAANKSMLAAVREFGEGGGRMLAECGGLLYLSRDIDGAEMCGLLPFSATMEGARLTLGYRTAQMPGMPPLKGHEFHYSYLRDGSALESVAMQTDAAGRPVDTRLYRYKNTIAGYTHLYWGDQDILNLWK
ncbi:MAG: cobyrinate a,c-diamide synthase [Muribaculaceae bacterium]|nr:cobyrinate a,c-diamide synthase [Muribaculaceae bacterium]